MRKERIGWFKLGYPDYIMFLLGLFGIVLPSFSQDINRRIRHYTTLEDLSQNTIDCILRDSRGFMWFGTWNGLNRFDGYHFTIYKADNQVNSLSNNFVYSLSEDNHGNLWIGTKSGLNQFDFTHDVFRSFYHDDQDFNTLGDNQINAVYCDQEGFIWAGTKNSGLDKIQYDYVQQRILKIWHFRNNPANPKSLAGNTINTIYADKQYNLWIGTNGGLSLMNSDKGSFQKISLGQSPTGSNNYNVLTLFEDRDGVFWIGTDEGLVRWVRASGEMKWYVPEPGRNGSLTHLTVNSITQDVLGNVIIGTLGGLNIYRKTTDDFEKITESTVKDFCLSNEFINSVLADNQGNVWIGTDKGGINQYNVHQKQFYYIGLASSGIKGLNCTTVNSVLGEKNVLWVGTAGGGLNVISKNTGSYSYYKYSAFDASSISSDFITSIIRDQHSHLWVGTWGNGLNKLIESGEKKKFERFNMQSSSIRSNFISSIWEDPRGFLLIGTFDGIDLFYPQKKEFAPFARHTKMRNITEVGCILQDTKGDYWFGSRIGLFYIKGNKIEDDLNDNDIRHFVNIPGDENSIPGNYIISLCEDNLGNIWAGTYGNGICRISETGSRNKKFESFTEKDGLCNNVVYSMVEDERGFIWLSTDNGLSRFNPADSVFRNFYVTDGLQSNQFYWSAANKNTEGWLYFGGTEGLNYFNPDSIRDHDYKPHVILTDLKIFNQSVPTGIWKGKKTILEQSITETSEIKLSYHENVFSLEFSALDYDQPEKIIYRYKMEGVDNGWVEVSSNRRFANYTNLKGGEYLFYVQSSNSSGSWIEKPTELKITITPPFWETNWFRILCVAMVLLSFAGYYQYHTHRLKTRKRELEKMVHERTAKIEEQNIRLEHQNMEISQQRDKLIELNKRVQLVNQLKLRFFTNISHEFRTPLTLIMGVMERFSETWKGDKETYQLVNLANRNARRLLHLINQLMEFRKIETGKLQLKVTKGDLSEFLNSILSSFNQLAQEKRIRYTIIQHPEPAETWFDHEKLENIIYNLVSNAFKYTPENGVITVDFGVLASEIPSDYKNGDQNFNQLKISVTDTGVGIPKDQIQNIFRRFYRVNNNATLKARGSGIGLSLTRELVKAHHGSIYVESIVGKGSTFTVQLPCDNSFYGIDETGTDSQFVPESTKLRTDYLVEEVRAEESVVSKPAVDKISEKPLLLIVEDNQDLRHFISINLKNKYQILEALNGLQGYEMAKRFSPQLIISDIMMPEMDGLELCTRIKENIFTSHIPVLLLTARTTVENWIEGLESGADDYIPKPFNLSILEAKIFSTIQNRQRLRKLFLTKINADPKELVSTSLDEQFLKKAIEVVETHYKDSEFSVEVFVEKMAVSRSLLHKKLSAIVDQSAGDFITHIRLNKSAELLKTRTFNISEIAYRVGFNDPKYFSRLFRRVYGVTPTEYTEGKLPVTIVDN
jgi:signal transduction histidine kinase/ligand-binding sensor domain-containing protein/DNA-binding response OmpR family regulator